MIKALIILLLLTGTCFGKYPYDSVGQIASGGSGSLIMVQDEKGLILTNAHVVSTTGETQIYWPAVQQARNCKTIYVHIQHDIALLVCEDPPVEPIVVSEPEGVEIVSTGFPYYDRDNLHWQKATWRHDYGHTLWVDKAPVPGMSGGSAFDMRGHQIGIVTKYQNNWGGLVSYRYIIEAMKVVENKEWTPDASHIREPQNWTFGTLNEPVRTIKYHEETAPDLTQ